ncbi:hypothetical protein FOB80_00100 [Aerococcus viridans]|nr:hypothetical protein FOB80_00100 [Aerococcus viridans]
MLKRYAILLVTSILVSGCINTSNNEHDANTPSTASEGSAIVSSSNSQASSQSVNERNEKASDTRIELIALYEIEEKIAAGDSFFVFLSGASDEENIKLEQTISETYDMIGDQLTDVYPEGEGYTYMLDPSENTDEYGTFLTDYQLEDNPALIYFEGQIYTISMNHLDVDTSKEDISRFIASPYDEYDITTAPDTKMDEEDN